MIDRNFRILVFDAIIQRMKETAQKKKTKLKTKLCHMTQSRAPNSHGLKINKGRGGGTCFFDTFVAERNLSKGPWGFPCNDRIAVKEVPVPASQLTPSFHFHITPVYPVITGSYLTLFSCDLNHKLDINMHGQLPKVKSYRWPLKPELTLQRCIPSASMSGASRPSIVRIFWPFWSCYALIWPLAEGGVSVMGTSA